MKRISCCGAWCAGCVLCAHSLAGVYLVLAEGTSHQVVVDGQYAVGAFSASYSGGVIGCCHISVV